MSQVEFYVLVEGNVVPVYMEREECVMDIYHGIKSFSVPLKNKLALLTVTQLTYFKLKEPVRNDAVESYVNESNLEPLDSYTRIENLAEQFKVGFACVLVMLPPDETDMAIEQLQQNYSDLFSRLQITVAHRGRWSAYDIRENGGVFVGDNQPTPREISDIETQLTRKRSYRENSSEHLRIALTYRDHFSSIFEPSLADYVAVQNDGEFVAFCNVLHCYHQDSERIAQNTSSSLKARSFMVYFIHPPFFSRRPLQDPLQYKEQLSWNFPMFIATRGMTEPWRKFTPDSDSDVISRTHFCPFVISDVMSQKHEQDRHRMLLEAIVAARTGSYLLKDRSQSRFFVVAVYLAASLCASRYIVTEADSGRQVHIARADFDLTDANAAVRFFGEMCNLSQLLGELAGELDELKRESLLTIQQVASRMRSLNHRRRARRSTSPSLSSNSDRSELQEEDDLGIFNSDQVRSILDHNNYEVSYVAFGHPHIALVVRREDDSAVGYLKFVEDGAKELEILQYLRRIDAPTNHTIRPVRIWPIDGGMIIFMPVAGGPLSSLKDPDSYLWLVAQQLFEAVDFMHGHGVAHLDLKPQNIIIPPNYGRLTIIDFSLSVRVNSPCHTFRRYVGTKGYIAPEVGRGRYNPIRADLWSCGKVVEELCRRCILSPARERLLRISNRLLDAEPGNRPTMAQVLLCMSEPDNACEGHVR